jgi:hypothetical protein
MRLWGKRVCRTRSGSPWRALRLIRSIRRVHARPRITRVRRRRPRGCDITHFAPRSRSLCRHSPAPAQAAEMTGRSELSTFDAYVSALLALDRHEIAALTLTLGVLCFAVVTAILLVRTRSRLGNSRHRHATKAPHRRPRSIALMRSSSPSAKFSSPGQPGRTSPRSSATLRCSPPPTPLSAFSLSAPGSTRIQQVRWSVLSTLCARAGSPSP